jgi:hypothetical protein
MTRLPSFFKHEERRGESSEIETMRSQDGQLYSLSFDQTGSALSVTLVLIVEPIREVQLPERGRAE